MKLINKRLISLAAVLLTLIIVTGVFYLLQSTHVANTTMLADVMPASDDQVATSEKPMDNPDFPDFPKGEFSSEIPHDVDILFLNSLAEEDIADKQRLFDIFSWQSFLAVNWPVDSQGQAKMELTSPGTPRWMTWKLSTDVFKPDGSDPGPWSGSSNLNLTFLANQETPCTETNSYLFNNDVSSTERELVLDTITQVGKNKLWDQNGNLVYYESLINELEYNYILTHTLYSLNGQINFTNENKPIYFPTGGFLNYSGTGQDTNPEHVGVMELKLAWKIISKNDISSRFFTKQACTLLENGEWAEATVGLVGMHIAHKTQSSSNWIWSTFEQVDNVSISAQKAEANSEQGETPQPSFYNPNCTDCKPNTIGVFNGITKTQVVRVIPIATATTQLNQQVQQRLADEDSVWQYYQLVGTQWPPNRQEVKPQPELLANTTMETYIQQKSSCMGCHYFAPIAVSGSEKSITWGKPGSGDFSFLLKKAYWSQ